MALGASLSYETRDSSLFCELSDDSMTFSARGGTLRESVSYHGDGALLPPFFLQRIIGFILSRTGENPEPVHVALLYAFGMLGTQVFLAFSGSAVSNRFFPLFIIFCNAVKLCSTETDLKSVVATEPNYWPASLRSAAGPLDYFDLHEIPSQNWS
jgi:hypothetical protein